MRCPQGHFWNPAKSSNNFHFGYHQAYCNTTAQIVPSPHRKWKWRCCGYLKDLFICWLSVSNRRSHRYVYNLCLPIGDYFPCFICFHRKDCDYFLICRMQADSSIVWYQISLSSSIPNNFNFSVFFLCIVFYVFFKPWWFYILRSNTKHKSIVVDNY